MQLHATCNRLWLSLGVFTTIRSNFNYFDHSYNYDAIIGNFILLVGWFLSLFSFMNILICSISCNSHQISHILNVFYGDIGLYFYVCIKIIFMIYYIYHKYIFVCILIMSMYVYFSYNGFLNWYFNLRNIYVNLNFLFAFWFFCWIKTHYLSLNIVVPVLKHFIWI